MGRTTVQVVLAATTFLVCFIGVIILAAYLGVFACDDCWFDRPIVLWAVAAVFFGVIVSLARWRAGPASAGLLIAATAVRLYFAPPAGYEITLKHRLLFSVPFWCGVAVIAATLAFVLTRGAFAILRHAHKQQLDANETNSE